MTLNKKQSEAVYNINGPIMVLAGAGSGKTRVITNKIAYLIENKKIKPNRIVGVTFTNKAAKEMKDRLREMLGYKKIRGINLTTFHSLCVKILRKEGMRIDFRPNFTIYSQSDQLSLIKQIMVDLNIPQNQSVLDQIAFLISHAKNQLILPDEEKKLTELTEGGNSFFINVYKLYQKKLHSHQAMDFDDLILYTYKLMENHHDINMKYQKDFQYLLVDEFQDTNFAQFELLKILTIPESNITIVGDDDQSIYSWRGSQITNFNRFEKEYKDVKIITLDQNYRSTQTILSSAGAIIEHNPSRIPKKIWSEQGMGEPIEYYECYGEDDEAEKVADLILTKKIRSREKYNQFAVLYRTNFQSRPFELAFREKNIPYKVVGGISFYDRKEVKDLIAYIKLINNTYDDVALLRIVNYPRRGIGDAKIDAIRNFANQNKLSLFESMERVEHIEGLDKKIIYTVNDFCQMIKQFQQEFERFSMSLTLSRLIDYIDYESAIYKLCKDEEEWRRKLTNINDFTKLIEMYEKKSGELMEDDYEPNLKGFLNHVSLLYEVPDKKNEEQIEDKVTLLTLHSAKGLEYNHVYLVGMEDGIIPHGNNENIEEERRLCYVGFTRAKKSLALTSCQKRKKFGTEYEQNPSQFIDAIPEELIVVKSIGEEEEMSEDSAKEWFADMKSLMSE